MRRAHSHDPRACLEEGLGRPRHGLVAESREKAFLRTGLEEDGPGKCDVTKCQVCSLLRLTLCPCSVNSVIKETGWEDGEGGLSLCKAPKPLQLRLVAPCLLVTQRTGTGVPSPFSPPGSWKMPSMQCFECLTIQRDPGGMESRVGPVPPILKLWPRLQSQTEVKATCCGVFQK